jgi:hypothetical protein
MKKKLLMAGITLSLLSIATYNAVFADIPDNTVTNATNATNATQVPYQTIQDKMLNAVDNFKNIKGSFRLVDPVANTDKTVEFEVDEGIEPGSFSKVINNKNQHSIEQHSDGDKILYLNKNLKEYQLEKVNKDFKDYDKALKDRPRHYKNSDGTNVNEYRTDPARAEFAKDVIFPQEVAFWINSQTQILGHEKLLNRDVTVIKGKLDDFVSAKLQGKDYKMWIDTETGILLKLVVTNLSQEEKYKLKVLSLNINEGVDRSEFSTKAPTGFTDRTPKFLKEKIKK